MNKMIQHLKSRHFNHELYKNLIITHDVVIFPLYNLSGQWVGNQQYRPDGDKKQIRNPKLGKYYTYITKQGSVSSLACWGLELVDMPKNNKPLYLVEGIFKACRFHNHNMNAIASLSNNPKNMFEWLSVLGFNVIPVCDGDKAGKKLARYGANPIILEDGIQVDDMTEIEFNRYFL